MSEAERLHVFLAGFEAGYACLLDTLRHVPDEHLRHVIEHQLAERRRSVYDGTHE